MVPNDADCEDIMQETTSLMWKKFDEFHPGSNFTAWAMTIAKFKILSYQRDRARSRIRFDENVIEKIEQASKDKLLSDNAPDKISFLKECIGKLDKNDLDIVQLKYTNSLTNKILANRVGVSIPTLYRHLSRIYANLLKCINNKLSAENI